MTMVGGVTIITFPRMNEIRSSFLTSESPGRVSSSCLVLVFFPLPKGLSLMGCVMGCVMGCDGMGDRMEWDAW